MFTHISAHWILLQFMTMHENIFFSRTYDFVTFCDYTFAYQNVTDSCALMDKKSSLKLKFPEIFFKIPSTSITTII